MMGLSISQSRLWCREGRDVTGRTGRKRQWGGGEGRGKKGCFRERGSVGGGIDGGHDCTKWKTE